MAEIDRKFQQVLLCTHVLTSGKALYAFFMK